ncbi:MAG: hypothetical protein M0Q54_03315 [Pigmentiphaga sp.]|nr:hypothetical protein [Pigmentiphaga sp.]
MKILSLLLVFLLSPGCNNGQEIEETLYFLIENGTEIMAPNEGMTHSCSVKSNGAWEVFKKSTETWVEIQSAHGSKDGSFQLIIHENKSTSEREMKLAVLLDGKEIPDRITITQSSSSTSIWDELKQDEQMLNIQLGIPSYNATSLIYRRNGTSVLEVNLEEPVVVGVADQSYGWGYFQFPNIYRSVADNSLVLTWSMSEDKLGGHTGTPGRMASTDNGKTWSAITTSPLGGGLLLSNGVMINDMQSVTKAADLNLPDSIAVLKEAYGRTFVCYRHDELPEAVQGLYLNRWDRNGNRMTVHAPLDDPGLVRYVDTDLYLLPITWWGDKKALSNGSIVTGVYPVFYENENGGVDPSCVAFYQSDNQGSSWRIKGKIPYLYDPHWDPNGYRRAAFGWTEPAFEVLSDGTFLCVLRTTDGLGDSPMYISRSFDEGITWSHPVPFTPAGVLPKLLQLDNGVLVLASGRPGLQLRFSFDGKGEEWTDPFELIPFAKGESSTAATCGYPRIVSTGPNSFLVAYSDFKYPSTNGVLRKAIKVREIKVDRIER